MLVLLFAALLITPTFAAVCTDRTVNSVEQIISPTGYNFNITRVTCNSHSAPVKRATQLETRSVVDERSASECTTTNCVCGSPCTIECFTNPLVPDITDCTNLRNSILATMSGTFTVAPGNPVLISGPGCEFEADVVNIGHSLQFCWDDFAAIGLENALVCSPNLLPECIGSFGGTANAWVVSDTGDVFVN
ncbi:hypothetical protein BYT27DRAFT_7252254 [Phlegmacium glaucopus]|nr:hypothetical protein BYT27DRAFT_7252254 [Phlegmacium glaucopus]